MNAQDRPAVPVALTEEFETVLADEFAHVVERLRFIYEGRMERGVIDSTEECLSQSVPTLARILAARVTAPPAALGEVEGEPTLSIALVAALWRTHANCNWVSDGVSVRWSCGIIHRGPIHMQPTTRDRHLAALVVAQVDADVSMAVRKAKADLRERLLHAAAKRAARTAPADPRPGEPV